MTAKPKNENLDQGYVKLYRSLKGSWMWKKSKKKTMFESWVDLLYLANHSDQKEPVGYDLIPVGRGQILTSQMKLAKEWGWSRESVNSFLKMLVKDSKIILNPEVKFTMITICNYELYNPKPTGHRHQTGRKSTPNRHQTDTFKNVKNLKNEKNKPEKPFSNWDNEKEKFFGDTAWQLKFYTSKKIPIKTLIDLMHEFVNNVELKRDYKHFHELQSHFTNLFNLKFKDGAAENLNATKPEKSARERKDEESLASVN